MLADDDDDVGVELLFVLVEFNDSRFGGIIGLFGGIGGGTPAGIAFFFATIVELLLVVGIDDDGDCDGDDDEHVGCDGCC